MKYRLTCLEDADDIENDSKVFTRVFPTLQEAFINLHESVRIRKRYEIGFVYREPFALDVMNPRNLLVSAQWSQGSFYLEPSGHASAEEANLLSKIIATALNYEIEVCLEHNMEPFADLDRKQYKLGSSKVSRYIDLEED